MKFPQKRAMQIKNVGHTKIAGSNMNKITGTMTKAVKHALGMSNLIGRIWNVSSSGKYVLKKTLMKHFLFSCFHWGSQACSSKLN